MTMCAISLSLSLSLSLALSLPISPILVHMLLDTAFCARMLSGAHSLKSYRWYAHVTRLIPCEATGSGSYTSYAHRSLQVVRTIFSCRWYAHLTRLIPCDATGIGSYRWYTLYVDIGGMHTWLDWIHVIPQVVCPQQNNQVSRCCISRQVISLYRYIRTCIHLYVGMSTGVWR